MATPKSNLDSPGITVSQNIEELRSIVDRRLRGSVIQFARFSYGEELTLHLGELQPARSPRSLSKLSGSSILAMRGSVWNFDLPGGSVSITNDQTLISEPSEILDRSLLDKIEERFNVSSGEKVNKCTLIFDSKSIGIGLSLRFGDGANFGILPVPASEQDEADNGLPILADWELITPEGSLSVGPGRSWTHQVHQNG